MLTKAYLIVKKIAYWYGLCLLFRHPNRRSTQYYDRLIKLTNKDNLNKFYAKVYNPKLKNIFIQIMFIPGIKNVS